MRMSLVTEVAPPHTLPPGTIANSAPCTHLTLERVMNSIRNGLGMRETEIAREPS
jgi:hypothetical protein